MKPLSPLLYFKRCLKSALPVFISIAVGVFLVYIYALFSATFVKMEDVATFDLMKKYNIAYTSDSQPLPASFLQNVKDADGSGVIAVQMNLPGLPYFRGGMGNASMLTFNIFDDDTARLLESYGVKRVEGALPRNNQNEILVPREYALYNHLAVGDFIGSEVSDKYQFIGKYKICGLTEGPVFFTVVCQPGNETKEQIMDRGVLYPVDHLSTATQKSLLNNLPANVVYKSYDSYKQSLDIIMTAMQSATYFLTGLIIIILCIALGNLNAIVFANRREEFFILNAIGYTKGNLLRRLWGENVLSCVAGYLAGIGSAEFAIWLLNNTVLYSQGQELTLFSLSGLISALAMPIFVSFFSLLPCLLHNFSKHADMSI
ncbi:MAG: FtsX-like permease family protein [Acetanaerobacterium sp.]